MSNNNILCLGVDDGYAETNIALPDGTCIRVPSQARAGEQSQISIDGKESTVYAYSTEEGPFVTGELDFSDTTEFDDYPVSPMNRVIVSHALRVAGIAPITQLYVCSGLPVKKFYRKDKPNKRLIKSKMANLLRNDVAASDGIGLPKIVKHDVVSEGIGAWIDYVIERKEDGTLVPNKDKINQRVAVIDIGGRTTDIAVIRRWNLDISRSSTIDGAGMLSVQQSISEEIYDEIEVELTNAQITEAISQKEITIWGKKHDVSSEIDKSLKTVVESIKCEVRRRLKKGADLDVVLIVGGTVNEIGKYISDWFPNQVIVENPGFANAMGFQKYAQFVLSKS